jgi:hypothetical protein
MHSLRNARHLVRLVLAWFALSIGVAVASPLVKPVSMELVCSGSGLMKLIVKTDDGAKEVRTHTLDCPLCMAMSAPPPALRADVAPAQPLAHALRPIPAAHIALLTAAPLPARGPPTIS